MKEQITISPASARSLGDLADAADVLDPVGVGKAQIPVEAVPHIVAVEQHRVPAERQQLLFDQIGDRRFAGARQPGQPQHRRGLAFERGPLVAPDGQRLPMDVAGPAQAKAIIPAPAVSFVKRSNQDESACVAVDPIGIERHRAAVDRLPNPISSKPSVLSTRCARVST